MSREWERAYHWFSREAVPAFGLTPPQIAVYNALRDRADDEGETFPSQDTIGRESGIGPRAVRAAVGRLVEVGLVEIIRRGRRGGIRYRIGMRPAMPETGSRIRNEWSNTGSRIRSIPDRGSDEEDPVKKTQNAEAPPHAEDGDQFEQFWDLYPAHRRGTKKAVRAAWDEVKPPADVIPRLRAWIPTVKDPKYYPRAEKWLRERQWSQITVQGPSAEYLAWRESPEGREHQRRKEAQS